MADRESESTHGAGNAEDVGDPRVCLASERTLLAWIRTGLALMGFGFVVARFGLFLREVAIARPAPGAPLPPTGFSLAMGVALVLLGVVVNLAAARQHQRFLREYDPNREVRAAYRSFGVALCVALAVIGMAMSFHMIWMR